MNISALFHLQIMMFLLMGAGILLRKKNIITPEGKKCLTDLIIDLILPCNIIHSFCVKLSQEILVSCIQILFVSIALQLLCVLIAATAYRRVPKQQRMCLQFGTVCSNSVFLGNPVAEGLYGSLGLLYASVYVVPVRLVVWSVGVSYFTQSPDFKSLMKKILTHPCIIAVEIGIVLMATQLSLPLFLDKSITALSNCTTAITMLFIGTVLADAGVKGVITPTTLGFSFVRLIAIPTIVLLGCLTFHVNETAAGVAVVLAAMPAGTTTAILASKYNGDEVFASRCIVLTTVLSMAMLPLWCMILTALF